MTWHPAARSVEAAAIYAAAEQDRLARPERYRPPRTVAERLGEAHEEVGEHHPGIPARAEHGGPGHGLRGIRKRRGGERTEGGGRKKKE